MLTICSGRTAASHYFVGVQGQHMFYLDPHQPRPTLPYTTEPVAEYGAIELDSCHTRRLRRLALKDMDPSMLLGFLMTDEEDWVSWKQGINEVQGKPVVHVGEFQPFGGGLGGGNGEREGAVDEVEVLSDEEGGCS